MGSDKTQGIGTRAIHAGQAPDPTTGAIMTPVYLTSTYVQESPGHHTAAAAAVNAGYAAGEEQFTAGFQRGLARLCASQRRYDQ